MRQTSMGCLCLECTMLLFPCSFPDACQVKVFKSVGDRAVMLLHIFAIEVYQAPGRQQFHQQQQLPSEAA